MHPPPPKKNKQTNQQQKANKNPNKLLEEGFMASDCSQALKQPVSDPLP